MKIDKSVKNIQAPEFLAGSQFISGVWYVSINLNSIPSCKGNGPPGAKSKFIAPFLRPKKAISFRSSVSFVYPGINFVNYRIVIRIIQPFPMTHQKLSLREQAVTAHLFGFTVTTRKVKTFGSFHSAKIMFRLCKSRISRKLLVVLRRTICSCIVFRGDFRYTDRVMFIIYYDSLLVPIHGGFFRPGLVRINFFCNIRIFNLVNNIFNFIRVRYIYCIDFLQCFTIFLYRLERFLIIKTLQILEITYVVGKNIYHINMDTVPFVYDFIIRIFPPEIFINCNRKLVNCIFSICNFIRI